jgi:PKD repeat protein
MMKKSKIARVLLFLIMFSISVAAESPVNQPPEAFFIASPSSGQSPLTVQFDASESVDMNGTIVSYAWDFGDGGRGKNVSLNYIYKNFGTYAASLKVTDDRGQTGIYTTKITVTSGASLPLTIIPNPVSIGTGEASIIQVTVKAKDGTPRSGVKVTLKSTGGNLAPDSGNTDPSGQFSSSFTAPEGTYRIWAIAPQTGINQVSGETTVRVSIKKSLSVEIASIPGSIGSNGTSNIKVIVKSSEGEPVSDANVMLIPDTNGTVSPSTGKTDSGGQFTATFTGSGEAAHSVKAVVKKNGYAQGSGNVSIAVSTANNISFMILIIFLIIIIGSAFQEFWIKGRLQVISLKTDVPCDGTSAIPVKLQFVDPTGKPRVQLKDRQVKVSTTSGIVMNIVVPKGKESAEAVLPSSHVCGLVKLTAQSGIQKAIANVNFAGNMAEMVLEVSPRKIPADGISISSVVIKVKDDKGNFITSLGEWVVEMTTTLGTITSPVIIPPGTISGIAILTSEKKTGTATVNATMGALHCEKKVVFEELPERFCMHCGDPLKREFETCPNCKKTPPPDTEIKECNSCQTVIPAQASFCDRCGAKQPV